MSTRISVTYPATDGSMPESVEVTWEDETPSDDLVHSLLGLLVHAASVRQDAAMQRALGIQKFPTLNATEAER